MARRRSHVPLTVYLNGRVVGRLDRQSSGAIDFKYDNTWLTWEHALPVSLSLPLREDRFLGAPVVAVLENLLPDNEQIRRQVAEHVGAEGYDAYSLLAKVGRDCVGALQFLPAGVEPAPTGDVSGRSITGTEVATILANLKRTPLGLDESEEFRISLAGVQEKTALLKVGDEWRIPHGTTATTHILKPEIGLLPNGVDLSQSIENEHFCMRLSAAFGLRCAKTSIESFDGKRALVVERFDRQWTRDSRLLRIPQEDCCQALSVPPAAKYESHGGPGIRDILQLLQGSDESEADQRAFTKAQIIFWLLGATDGHAKNFSIFLLPGARFRLTPLYDVMSTQPYVDAGQLRRNQVKLAMAVGNSRHYVIESVTPRHFLETTTSAGFPADFVPPIFEELLRDADRAVESTIKQLPEGFPEAISGAITEGLRRRLHRLANA
jgi:serine/threonine-protein kinase HipA